MNFQYGGMASAESQKNILSSTARAFLAGLALAGACTAAMAAINPIPGVDIIVKKNPGGHVIVTATSDRSGHFTARVTEPGEYTVTTACRQPSACRAHTLSINGGGLVKSGGGTMPYSFTVTARNPVVLTGQIMGKDDGAANPNTRAAISTTR